jgi:photoactive yellow protein
MQTVAFGSKDIESSLASMNEKQLDDLAFGAVQLDPTGAILAYNVAEGSITGRDPKSVIGKNFFTEVAPCTNSKGFRDVFDNGVKAGRLNALLEWTFDNKMAATKVQVHMKKAAVGEKYWIFVKRL